LTEKELPMDSTQAESASLVSRREALMLVGAMAAMRSAGAVEAGMLQPATLDHVNLSGGERR
jgi:hypothetical protein